MLSELVFLKNYFGQMCVSFINDRNQGFACFTLYSYVFSLESLPTGRQARTLDPLNPKDHSNYISDDPHLISVLPSLCKKR
jgi:hypothetical protein